MRVELSRRQPVADHVHRLLAALEARFEPLGSVIHRFLPLGPGGGWRRAYCNGNGCAKSRRDAGSAFCPDSLLIAGIADVM